MRHIRFIIAVIFIFLLAWFLFENHDALTIAVLVEFSPLGAEILRPTPIEIWKVFLGTVFISAAVTYLYNVGKQLGLRGEIWKRDRELRSLKADLEDRDLEIKRLKAAAGEEQEAAPEASAGWSNPSAASTGAEEDEDASGDEA